MRAVRKDYFLDHDHSCLCRPVGLGAGHRAHQRNLDFLKTIVSKIWKVITGAEEYMRRIVSAAGSIAYPNLPEELTFLHAEEILDMYPDLPRKQRETRFCRGIRRSSSLE